MTETSQSARRAQSFPQTPSDISLFEENGRLVFRTQEGMTIYRHDLDVGGESGCVDACSKRWPPLIASAGATPVVGDWRTIARGAIRQWSYRGHPVYTYALDMPGTSKGDGVDGLWHMLVP